MPTSPLGSGVRVDLTSSALSTAALTALAGVAVGEYAACDEPRLGRCWSCFLGDCFGGVLVALPRWFALDDARDLFWAMIAHR